MPYTPHTWVDNVTAATAARLNNIESGIQEALATTDKIISGGGSPEGVVTADIGSLYLRIDGGGVALYAKQTGTGTNTGWFALSGVSPDPYVPEEPAPPVGQPAPLSEYGFNEGSGLTAYDLSGNARHLTASNTTTSWTASTPKFGAASAKTQHTGWVGPDLLQPNYTIMFWARREGTWANFAGMFQNAGQGMWMESDANASYRPSIYAGTSYAVGTTGMTLNTWYHIAGTRNSSGATQIFVNGVLEGTATGNVSPAGLNFGGGNGTYVVASGATGSNAAYNGSIDDLRIFDSVLTAGQITTEMNDGITASGAPGGGGGGGGGGGTQLSGASYIGYPSSDLFGTYRGTATQIAGTWMNQTDLPTIKAGAEYGAWTAPMDIGLSPPTWSGWAAEAAGANDAFWTAAFNTMNSLRAGKGTTYVRPWYEFNGTWMSWTVHNDAEAAQFKTAWNRIAGIARARFPAVKMMIGAAAANGYSVASCWPTATVDALSIDFYNNWPFTTTQGGFDSKIVNAAGVNSLENLRQLAYTKGVPVVVSEWANCGIDDGGGGGGGESTAFIIAMKAWFVAHAGTGPGQVAAELYFNGWPQFRLYNVEGGAAIGSTAQPTTKAQYATSF